MTRNLRAGVVAAAASAAAAVLITFLPQALADEPPDRDRSTPGVVSPFTPKPVTTPTEPEHDRSTPGVVSPFTPKPVTTPTEPDRRPKPQQPGTPAKVEPKPVIPTSVPAGE